MIAVAVLVTVVIILAVALPWVGIIRSVRTTVRWADKRLARVLISDVYDSLKTGDLILYRSYGTSIADGAFTQVLYTHAGLVMREGDSVVVTESQLGTEIMPPGLPGVANNRMQSGVDIVPLLIRLKYYSGTICVARLAEPLTPQGEEALKAAADELYRGSYPYPTASQMLAMLLGATVNARHCFQHVANLMDVAGAVPADLKGKLANAGPLEVCRLVCGIAGRKLLNGGRYCEPAQLVYDIDSVV